MPSRRQTITDVAHGDYAVALDAEPRVLQQANALAEAPEMMWRWQGVAVSA